MIEAEFPRMRDEVMFSLACFSDRRYQEQVWLRREGGPEYFDDLTLIINILYDDCQVLPNPELRIGSVLLPSDEIERLAVLHVTLGALIDELGEMEDAAYLSDPRWAHVVEASAAALAAMVRANLR
jgi:hypothetical protein